MTPADRELRKELLDLRGRRGLLDPRLATRVGPRLHQLSGTSPADPERFIRERVKSTITSLIYQLQGESRRAAELAFAADPQHAYGRLEERQQVLQSQLKVEQRTARRRMDEALDLMVELADATTAVDPADTDSRWRVARMNTLMRLDTPTPELYETRRFLAVGTVKQLLIELDLPAPPSGEVVSGGLAIDVLYGARIQTIVPGNGGRHYSITLDLPRTLAPHDTQDVCLHYRVSHGRPIRDHYAIVPLCPYDLGRVRVRFAPDRLPAVVWRLDGVAPRLFDDPEPGNDRCVPDAAGDIVVPFTRLRPGRGYGLVWSWD